VLCRASSAVPPQGRVALAGPQTEPPAAAGEAAPDASAAQTGKEGAACGACAGGRRVAAARSRSLR
jgi:hypothetical protein